MLNRVEIKTKAKKIIANNKWNIWKPALIIYASLFVLELVIGFLSIPLVGTFFIMAVSLPLSVGFLSYQLAIVRKEEFNVSQIFQAYKKTGVILLTGVLTYIFTLLWTCLFIIPGIIAAYSYIMSFYILADKKKNIEGAYQVIMESKNMMKGYKIDYFVFVLSFLGWFLLCGITFGLAFIYVFPYVSIANAIYYDELKRKWEEKEPQ